MKKLTTKVLLGLCLLSSTVIAQDMYVKGNIGFGLASGDATISGSTSHNGIQEIEGDSNLGYGIALGYKLNDNVRIEAEYLSLSSDLEQIVTSTTSSTETYLPAEEISFDTSFLMLNIYKDWTNWYVGFGLGTASTNVSKGTLGTNAVKISSGSSTGSAYSLSLGYKKDIDEKLFYDISFKYLGQNGSSTTKNSGTIVVEYEPSYFIGSIGIGYKF